MPRPGLAGAPAGGNCGDSSNRQRKQERGFWKYNLEQEEGNRHIIPTARETQAHFAGEARQNKVSQKRSMGPRTQLLQMRNLGSPQVPTLRRGPQNALYLHYTNANNILVLLSGPKTAPLGELGKENTGCPCYFLFFLPLSLSLRFIYLRETAQGRGRGREANSLLSTEPKWGSISRL